MYNNLQKLMKIRRIDFTKKFTKIAFLIDFLEKRTFNDIF